ncbi:MAG: hypothetical protein FWB96_00915 [Defluviitaleaceae bacterium]|nr:hypothetical protein [Defluviitaleaceae bacterium]MCL2262405.1 hypothetical protein [Defluviitaleaceae bacterium]
MTRLIAFLALVFLLAGCGRFGNEILPMPQYTGEEISGYFEMSDVAPKQVEISAPIEVPPPEVPRYNEYRISLDVNPEKRVVSGISHITFTNRASVPLDDIVLRVFLDAYMKIQYAFLDNEPLEFELDETVLRLILPEPLQPHATVQILLQYNASVPKTAHLTGGNDYALWFGMFLPVLSVFDEQDGWFTRAFYPVGNPFLLETANFRVDITTPARYVVVGTGLRTEEVISDTDTRITNFAAHQARDFSFAVSPYFRHVYTSTKSGIDIHLYYYTKTLFTDEILDIARRTMEFFEARVGVFPLGKVTIVEADLPQDSVSFSQMVFANSSYLTHSERYWAVAHGLGNQWLANIIGTNRITEPWLTEGLTRFIQAGIFYPTPQAFRDRMEREHASIEARTTLFINRGLDASPNRAHFAHTHGRKAMLMTYALHHRMGDDLFWQFINAYYQNFSFAIATQSDFIALAEELYGASLQALFDEWMTVGTVPELP